MKILAADTSTSTGSVALLEKDRLVAEWTLDSDQTHNRRLLTTVDFVLRETGWAIRDIDGFAATAGPGSFTGLRIGLSTIKTTAWVLKKPFAAISSLDALAIPLSFTLQPVCALVDARKKEVYCGIYKPDGKGNHCLQGSYQVMPPEQIADHITEPTFFCGNGWLLYQDFLCDKLGERVLEVSGPYHTIRAGFVGILAYDKFLSGIPDDPMTSTPFYVRPSEAEIHNPHLASRFLR
jgi:tRNA threonylcarbamoyl adenosine modification protein YeaZ